MIEELNINNFEFFETNVIKLAKYNLFIGKNGSGKSFTLKSINRNSIGIVFNNNERRNSIQYYQEYRLIPNFRTDHLAVNHPDPSNMDDISFLWLDDEFIEELNPTFKKIFNRELEIKKSTSKGPYINYIQDGNPTDPKNDGYGIINFMKLLSTLTVENKTIYLVEEPTIGFHMSITKNFLQILKNSPFRDNQYIFTSQDLTFIIEFFKLRVQEPENYKVFKFTKEKGMITVKEVNGTRGELADLDDEFPSLIDIETIQSLFARE